MGYKYHVFAAKYPFHNGYDEDKGCDTLEECVEAIKDFQNRGLCLIDVKIRDFFPNKQNNG